MKKFLFFAALLTLTACEKEISIDLNSADPKLVIEGEISNEVGPYTVTLTKTVNFSDRNDFPLVSGAVVTISDNTGFSETLVESSRGYYETSQIKGVVGRTYTLSVEVEGKKYVATSTIPEPVKLDSIDIKVSDISFPGQSKDTNYTIIPVYTDPASFGNNYRFIQYKNDTIDKTVILFNDNVNNGLRNKRPLFSRDFDLNKGYSYTLEMRCIDKSIYDYFYSLNQSSGNGPGGGTTPSNPVTNFSNGALGYFSAHHVQRMTVIVP